MVVPWLIGLWAFCCGFFDLTQRRLPNMLTLGMHVPALLILLITGQGALGASWFSCLSAWGVAIILTLPAYAMKWLGAGDVKLLAAIGLLCGLPVLLFCFAIAGLLAGTLVLAWRSAEYLVPYLNLYLARFQLNVPPAPVMQGRILPFGSLLAIGLVSSLLLNVHMRTGW
ncbi:prepilin peptidase [Methylophaga sp. OBS4]|uniref:prepilin peptidase n=1 Tax=Methylophaga sp. OBS4 TaxID=2991935 RepID=UPI00225501EC|nr:prepilin peptidase [Methylophaga sp. OBS4]MCX4187518.1 prepilin peptidase [Methylophaga sp. OBS4]